MRSTDPGAISKRSQASASRLPYVMELSSATRKSPMESQLNDSRSSQEHLTSGEELTSSPRRIIDSKNQIFVSTSTTIQDSPIEDDSGLNDHAYHNSFYERATSPASRMFTAVHAQPRAPTPSWDGNAMEPNS